MKNSFLIFFSILFIISNFSITAQKGKHRKAHPLKMIENLNLDDLQREKIEDMYLQKEENKIELQTELKKNRLEIKKMMVKDNLKNDELLELVEKGGKIRNDLVKSRVSFFLFLICFF
jgi:Spy/CpxP family protein refolding chaperone